MLRLPNDVVGDEVDMCKLEVPRPCVITQAISPCRDAVGGVDFR